MDKLGLTLTVSIIFRYDKEPNKAFFYMDVEQSLYGHDNTSNFPIQFESKIIEDDSI